MNEAEGFDGDVYFVVITSDGPCFTHLKTNEAELRRWRRGRYQVDAMLRLHGLSQFEFVTVQKCLLLHNRSKTSDSAAE